MIKIVNTHQRFTEVTPGEIARLPSGEFVRIAKEYRDLLAQEMNAEHVDDMMMDYLSNNLKKRRRAKRELACDISQSLCLQKCKDS